MQKKKGKLPFLIYKEKDGYIWQVNFGRSTRTPLRNIVLEKTGLKMVELLNIFLREHLTFSSMTD